MSPREYDGPACRQPRPNTVYLRTEDGDGVLGPAGGLGPVSVDGALDAVVAHLALDHARGCAQPPFREPLEQDLLPCADLCVSQRGRGKKPGGTPGSRARPPRGRWN